MVDGEGREGGENADMHVNGIRRGGAQETAAAVTVQSLSNGYCTARVARLGLTLDQLVPRVTRPG